MSDCCWCGWWLLVDREIALCHVIPSWTTLCLLTSRVVAFRIGILHWWKKMMGSRPHSFATIDFVIVVMQCICYFRTNSNLVLNPLISLWHKKIPTVFYILVCAGFWLIMLSIWLSSKLNLSLGWRLADSGRVVPSWLRYLGSEYCMRSESLIRLQWWFALVPSSDFPV